MTLDSLCAAAIEYSDNTAGNLLLQAIGGPAELTDSVRSLGDSVTRLDHVEPDLNSAIKADDRDTTSPAAMLGDLKSLLLEDRLSPESRERLTNWLVANTTGAKRLRAGLPATWRIGDKTGTGDNGAMGDIAIAWLELFFCAGLPAEELRNALECDGEPDYFAELRVAYLHLNARSVRDSVGDLNAQ